MDDAYSTPEMPTFRIKRAHKKSRRGCLVCKQRRVKCDEVRPACNVCIRRRLDCSYGKANHYDSYHAESTEACALDSLPQTSADSVSTTTSSLLGVGAEPNFSATTETDLLQHYLHHSVRNFDLLSTRSQSFWHTVVPALSHNSRVIRLGMMTISALCLCNDAESSDSGQSLRYLQVAKYYGDQFVEVSSHRLGELDTGNADLEQLTCSRLLTLLSLAFFRVYQHYDGVTIVDANAWTWLHMLRGTKITLHRYRNVDGKITGALANELAAEIPSTGARDDFKLSPHFRFVEHTRHQRFAALYRSIPGNDQADDVRSAICILENVTEKMCSSQIISLIHCLCEWPCEISKGFVNMLVCGDLLALAIHAHWLMLVALAEETWFIGNMGRIGIQEIHDRCTAGPGANIRRSLLDWPMQVLSDH